MARGKRSRKFIMTVLLLLLLFLTVYFTPFKTALVFQYQNSGRVLAYIPVTKGDKFQIKYTHSIHLSDVIERYSVAEDQQIKLYAMSYEDFAVGMPENALEGERFEHKNGHYYISDMNRLFPFFDLRVGKVRANHILILAGHEYPMSRYLEPGTWVRIKIDRLNLWQQWKGVNIHE
ncbi:DUF1850 domain-containing protein [Bacillus benzoevorans]|uniref:DUF1850 domain-containing protein n=1 Tax=Bacillus benzoevorans TaxID=1456 RepID=A0A7X0HMR7_9BACI|nr:DUF1850 domain-containing protein [Bacillus benzoevorans]MBB6443574.1 hypothetical protein [Bacillus benzoevorans]